MLKSDRDELIRSELQSASERAALLAELKLVEGLFERKHSKVILVLETLGDPAISIECRSNAYIREGSFQDRRRSLQAYLLEALESYRLDLCKEVGIDHDVLEENDPLKPISRTVSEE